jgi:hypothetical protein
MSVAAPASVRYKSYSAAPDTDTGSHWLAGFYNCPAADANLDEGGATQTYGTNQDSRAAHAILVAGGAGSVDAGSCSIVVSGTSVTDAGVATESDSETIVSDITAMSADDYYETTKKWLGQITYTLTPDGAATYSADFNYGFAKYDDIGNRPFTIAEVEMVCEGGGAADTSFDCILYHHSSTGWTYHATAFSPGGTVLAQLSTDHTDGTPTVHQRIINNLDFAWKKTGIDTAIDGAGSEGFVIEFVTGQASSIEHLNAHVGFYV